MFSNSLLRLPINTHVKLLYVCVSINVKGVRFNIHKTSEIYYKNYISDVIDIDCY